MASKNKFIALLGDNWYEGYVVSSGHKVYSDFHFGYWDFCHYRHKDRAIDISGSVSDLQIFGYSGLFQRFHNELLLMNF